MEKKKPPCDICNQPSVGAYTSPIAPITHNYCRECIRLEREPWPTLIKALVGILPGMAADWVKPIIKHTCEFYGKTEEAFWQELSDAWEDIKTNDWADKVTPKN